MISISWVIQKVCPVSKTVFFLENFTNGDQPSFDVG
jgi:hypothetical protein